MIGLAERHMLFFFFNDTATTEIYTLSLHDALPICGRHDAARDHGRYRLPGGAQRGEVRQQRAHGARDGERSEEHTSELQSRLHLVCRLLLEKKKRERSSAKLITQSRGCPISVRRSQ